jgi:hypothetical protein
VNFHSYVSLPDGNLVNGKCFSAFLWEQLGTYEPNHINAYYNNYLNTGYIPNMAIYIIYRLMNSDNVFLIGRDVEGQL